MRISSTLILIPFLLILLSFFPRLGEAQDLPQLYEGSPERLYQILGPVGAGAKDIPQARTELQRQADKMQADAVVQVRCDSGGIKREGLNFSKVQAYCRGIGVRFVEGASKPVLEETSQDSLTKIQ